MAIRSRVHGPLKAMAFVSNAWSSVNCCKLPIYTGKLFEKVILRIIQRHIEGNNLLNPCQFGFRACHSTTLQCMHLADHVTLNFDMSMAMVFLDVEKAFDTTSPWLSELQFSPSLIKLINSFLSHRKQSYG